MYTNCPECGTVFRISTNELRLAEGNVRCGHCSATFNALATLADQPPAEPPPEPGLVSEPVPPGSLPPVEAAATYVPLPISGDTLEFDIPESSWSNFFEGSAQVPDAPASGDHPPPAQTDVGDGIGSETMDQAGLHRVLAAESASPALDDRDDWEALLAEVDEDDTSPQLVYVISEEPPAESVQEPAQEGGLAPTPEPALHEHSWDDPPGNGTMAPVPLPTDFAADLPGAVEAGSGALEEAEPFTADRPFLWTPPVAPATIKPNRHWFYTAGSVLLALLLVIQVLHRQRDELATHPTLTEALQRIYTALGLTLWPAWDLRAYELRNSEAVADRSNPGALDILARIAVVGDDRVGLPFVRVTLRDGLSRPMGSRVFKPAEYLGKNPRPREPVSPGTMIPVEITLKDPGRDAQGFDVDVCVMSREEGMLCRAERDPFLR